MTVGIQGGNLVKVMAQDNLNPTKVNEQYVNRKQVSSIEKDEGDTALIRMQNGDEITVKASVDETAALLSNKEPYGQNLDIKA